MSEIAGEAVAGASGPGTVVLAMRPGCGALVLQAPPELDGTEIHISLAADPGHRTHAVVRPRTLPDRIVHAAVYPDLQPGTYIVWHAARAGSGGASAGSGAASAGSGAGGSVATTAAVAIGMITTTTWPAEPPAGDGAT